MQSQINELAIEDDQSTDELAARRSSTEFVLKNPDMSKGKSGGNQVQKPIETDNAFMKRTKSQISTSQQNNLINRVRDD